VEAVSWTIYIDEIKRSVLYLYDPDYGDPGRVSAALKRLVTSSGALSGYAPVSVAGDDLQQLYRNALRQVSSGISYWKQEAARHQTLIRVAARACAKCTHVKSNPVYGGMQETFGPVTTVWAYASVKSYNCHRYPKTVDVTAFHECGEFQGAGDDVL
jgi:hypothetical protein